MTILQHNNDIDDNNEGGLSDLNVVCNEAAAVISNISRKQRRKKPKKRNKYEKRREKARQAKEAKARAEEEGDITKEDSAVLESCANNHDPLDDSFKTKSSSVESSLAVAAANDNEEDDDRPNTNSSSSFTDDNGNEKPHETMMQNVKEDTPAAAAGQEVKQPITANSRRVHLADNSHNDNVEERARYMREFHARPLEMDRRSGATAHFEQSKESSHLFDGDAAGSASIQKFSNSWKSLQLHNRMTSTLQEQYNKGPTMIQSRAISLLQNSNNNVFIQSETGSGKTLAYLLPILQSCAIDPSTGFIRKVDRKEAGTRCLVLCPTRELANQVHATANQLYHSTFPFVVSGCLSGGESRKSEKARIRKGLTVLVATPGRFLDHLTKTESLQSSVKNLQWLVLDEADRLLDMGLGGQVEQVVQRLSSNNNVSWWRSVLVSATVSKTVEELADTMLGNNKNNSISKWKWARGGGVRTTPTKDGEDNVALTDSTPRQLRQLHMTVSAKLRLTTLVAFLVQRVQNKERTVVFMSTCDSVDYHHALFQAMDSIMSNNDDDEQGIFGKACPIFKLHGNVPHVQRHTTLQQFEQCNESALLLATDVAARGLNLPVDWILQYDAPCEVSDYIHRAGRAARAGRAGHALLFCLPSEKEYLSVLQQRGLNNMVALSLNSTLNSAAKITKDALQLDGKNDSRLGEAFSLEVQSRLENCILEDDAKYQEQQKALLKQPQRKRSAVKPIKTNGPLLQAAIQAYTSFVRAYPTKEKSVRHIFSARAMHLGHVARSFALKEPPTKAIAAGKKQQQPQRDDTKKRNASLAFTESNEKNSNNKRKGGLEKSEDCNKGDTKRARSILLARAQKLQDGGMDAF